MIFDGTGKRSDRFKAFTGDWMDDKQSDGKVLIVPLKTPRKRARVTNIRWKARG